MLGRLLRFYFFTHPSTVMGVGCTTRFLAAVRWVTNQRSDRLRGMSALPNPSRLVLRSPCTALGATP